MASSSSYSFFFLIYFSFPTSQGLLSEEELAHLEQASAVATEVTSSIVRLKLEVEEKKRAISLLQTALVGGSASPACWGAKEKSPQHPLLGAEALERGITAVRIGLPIRAPAGPSPAVLPEPSGEPEGRGVLGHAALSVAVSRGRIPEVLPLRCGLSLSFLLAASWFENHLGRRPASAQRRAVLNPFPSSVAGGLGGPTDGGVGALGTRGLG